jgi:DNA-binding MarR family transcriptional regulator
MGPERAGRTRAATADRLHSLAIHLLRHARVEDTAMGLSAARASVLSALVFGGPRTVTELAAAEQVSAPTMTRLLQALEAEGYVRRRRGSDDARTVEVTATARGRRVLDAGRRARVKRVERLLASASAADLAAIDRAADVLTAALASAVAGESAPP